MHEYDVFISHASEDKDSIARPLASNLRQLGLSVWYDEFTLKIGDSLSASIDRGLRSSRFGVVVLSTAFVSKPWPEYEYRSLIALESGETNRILPVRHNISREDLLKFSPHLVDKLAIDADRLPLIGVAAAIAQVANPAKFHEFSRRLALRRQLDADAQWVALSKTAPWPWMREPLSESQLRRLRLVQEALMDVYPQEWDEIVHDFRLDRLDGRDGEIEIWERIAGTYLNISRRYRLKASKRKSLIQYLLNMSLGHEISSGSEVPDWLRAAAREFAENLPDVSEGYTRIYPLDNSDRSIKILVRDDLLEPQHERTDAD